MSEEEEIHQLATNYIGPMSLIRLVLPHMRRVGRGKIINVSSVSGMLAMPTMASYSASKFALEGASESLWYELRPLGVNVTLVQPGFVHSDSFKRVYYSRRAAACATDGITEYGDYYRHMSPFIERMMNLSRTSPKQVAMKILRIIRTQNPPLRVAGTLDARLFYYLRRCVPRSFFHSLLFRCLPHSRRWGREYSQSRKSVRLLTDSSSAPKAAP
jgi:short-subunit dehydrogenase